MGFAARLLAPVRALGSQAEFVLGGALLWVVVWAACGHWVVGFAGALAGVALFVFAAEAEVDALPEAMALSALGASS